MTDTRDRGKITTPTDAARARWQKANAKVVAIEAERSKLLEPTKARYDRACDVLELIEDDLPELVAKCEGCTKPIFDGDPYFGYDDDGIYFCKPCAPTFEQMLKEHQYWTSNATGEAMTKKEAQAWVDKHVSEGGEITDSMARR